MKFKLGRKPTKHIPMLKMSGISDTLPPPMEENLKFKAVPKWLLNGNDAIGDCVVVAACNIILLTSTLDGHAVAIDTADTEAYYSKLSGYTPDNPLSDTGLAETDFLMDWRNNGFKYSGGLDKLIGFLFLEPKSHYQIKQAIDQFGACLCGVNFPSYWESIVEASIWGLPPASFNSESIGGHGMAVVGYDKTGFYVISWGMIKLIPYEAFDAYTEETYAVLLTDWLGSDNISPNGRSFKDLVTAMAQL